MGNGLGGKKKTKMMKINGETIKLKTPIEGGAVSKEYPGYVLLDSEAVKPKRVYFLVELPKVGKPRKVMSAKDRLESLKLGRRSVSDLTLLMQPKSSIGQDRAIGDNEND